jgi:hypothetical protein
MFNFGQEITSVCSGTTCPKQVAQYHRNIHSLLMIALITVIILMRNRITSIVIYYKLMVHSLLLLLYLFLICFIQQYLLPAV